MLIIGDYTAKVGDPSGRSKTSAASLRRADHAPMRSPTSSRQPRCSTWTRSNSPATATGWDRCAWTRSCSLTATVTVARMLERDDFSRRYLANEPVSMLEFMYPLLQGYDSVAVRADVELGGTDQKFNLLMGRTIMEAYGQAPQSILTVPLLVGTDGEQKMSKSYGNYIGVDDAPEDMFGKVMSIPDSSDGHLSGVFSAGAGRREVESVERASRKVAIIRRGQARPGGETGQPLSLPGAGCTPAPTSTGCSKRRIDRRRSPKRPCRRRPCRMVGVAAPPAHGRAVWPPPTARHGALSNRGASGSTTPFPARRHRGT